MGEKEEYKDLMERARKLAKEEEISLSEALLLMAVHEAVCLHFHVDQGFILGAIKHVDDKRLE